VFIYIYSIKLILWGYMTWLWHMWLHLIILFSQIIVNVDVSILSSMSVFVLVLDRFRLWSNFWSIGHWTKEVKFWVEETLSNYYQCLMCSCRVWCFCQSFIGLDCEIISNELSLFDNVVVDNVLNWGSKIVRVGNTNCQQLCANWL
jgi:hypothetical protein